MLKRFYFYCFPAFNKGFTMIIMKKVGPLAFVLPTPQTKRAQILGESQAPSPPPAGSGAQNSSALPTPPPPGGSPATPAHADAPPAQDAEGACGESLSIMCSLSLSVILLLETIPQLLLKSEQTARKQRIW